MKVFNTLVILGVTVTQSAFAFGPTQKQDIDGRLNRIDTTLNQLKSEMTVATGTQGDPGDAGPQGDPGKPGPQGPQGISLKGATGPRGAPGPAGPVGPAGTPAGPQGLTGPQGPQGDVGPQGIAGINGANGVRGPTGPKGAKGPTGFAGTQGPTGPQGANGFTGYGIDSPATRVCYCTDQSYYSGVQLSIKLTFPNGSQYTFNKAFFSYSQYSNDSTQANQGCSDNRSAMCN